MTALLTLCVKGFGGGEQLTAAPTKPVTLPPWAETALATIRVPTVNANWSDVMLPNKMRVIVKTDQTSPTVTVIGNIRHESGLQEGHGKEGVADVLDELFSYGTTGSRFRRRWTTSPPKKAPATTSRSAYRTATSRAAWNCLPTTCCIRHCRRMPSASSNSRRRNFSKGK